MLENIIHGVELENLYAIDSERKPEIMSTIGRNYSELTAKLSILLKHATLGNRKLREIENESLSKKISEERIFEPKMEDRLDEVIEIINVADVEHKKLMFPYVEPTVKAADEIETNQRLIDENFIDIHTKFDEVNDVVTEQKKQTKKKK